MSTKQLKSLGVSIDEEKKFSEQLRKHLANDDEGTLRRRADPDAFPLIDNKTIAKYWKSNYSSRFNRYSLQSLENIITATYDKLRTDTEKAAPPPVISNSNALSVTKGKKTIVTKEKAVVKRQKTTDGCEDPASQQLVSVISGTISGGNTPQKVKNAFISTPAKPSAGPNSRLFQKTVFDTEEEDINEMTDVTSNSAEIDDENERDYELNDLCDEDDEDEGNEDDSKAMSGDDAAPIVVNITTNTTTTPAKLVANVNSNLNNIYNPNAIPYDQRPSKPPQKKQTKDQIVKQIQQDAIDNTPQSVELKRVYRSFARQGYQHRAAEALARKSLGMEFNPDHLPANMPKNFKIKNQGVTDGSNKSSSVVPIRPITTLSDVGGIDNIIQDIREMIEYPLTHPEIYSHLGVNPPRGVLLHGPPGCGKTLLAHAIAGELQLPLIKLQATEIVSKLSGESENKIRQVFQDAAQHAPCIIFIDELDVIAGKKDNDDSSDMKRRIVTQLMVSIDALNEAAAQNISTPDPSSLTPEEMLARPDVGFNPSTGKMEIVKSTAEKALEMNENSELMLQTTLINNNNSNKTIIVIGATSKVESIDTALRRAGRFDREIAIGIPDESARAKILEKLTSRMRLSPDCDLAHIGKKTVGFVGADLLALTREAATYAINRIFNNNDLWLRILSQQKQETIIQEPNEDDAITHSNNPDDTKQLAMQLMSLTMDDCEKMNDDETIQTFHADLDTSKLTKSQKIRHELEVRHKISTLLRECGTLSENQLSSFNITHDDFLIASKKVQPTAKREGFATVPETTWADVGALDLLRAELEMAIVQPIQDPELFESLGLNTPAGVLLFGPPGCGKTLVAKAVANASGASFLSVKGPELLNQYVGESERAVRQVFKRAAMCSPCVIFFDELDALVPKRGGGGNGGSQASERVVNQLLTELDGFDDRRHVFVIAATNRPDIIDPAVLRPGRLDKLLFIPLPDANGRYSILLTHTRRTPLNFTEFEGASDSEKRSSMLRQISNNPHGEGYSGADMQALVREATTAALKEFQLLRIQNPTVILSAKDITVNIKHFDIAFTKVRASVSPQSRREYEQLCERITQGKGILRTDVHTIEDGSQCGGSSR